MKKITSIVLSVLMLASCIALASCGGKSGKQLIMATNAAFPPYEYVEGGDIVGIDAEVAAEIAKKLDMELKIEDTDFGAIIGGVQSGKYDMGMAGMTVTEERLEDVDFSETYAKGVQVVIVKEDSPYETPNDFYTLDADGNPDGVKDDIMIGVQQDTTGDIYASDTIENGGYTEDKVVRYKTGADAVQALITDKVTCVIIDNEPAKEFVKANEGLKIMDTEYTDEDYAICVQKGNTELLDKINKALGELKNDGTLDKIVEKYIPSK